jgi:serine protease inhibitor
MNLLKEVTITNKDLFEGFNDIKADKYLITKTKRKMVEPNRKKIAFSPKKLAFACIPVVAVAAALSLLFTIMPFGSHAVLTAKAQDLMEGISPGNVDCTGAVTSKFITSTQRFSIELFKNSVKSGENTLVSPISVCFSLGMVENGANGKTQDAFQNVLGKYGMTPDKFNKAYKAYADELAQKRGSTVVTIANSIWIQTGFTAKAPFLQTNADYFNAGARTIDFQGKTAVDTINDWVKKNTDNKIDKITDGIDSDVVMMLINAFSFDAKWQMPFDTETKASEQDFYLENASTKKATFMVLCEHMDYMEGQNEKAVLLPYDDKRFAFLCILPNDGVRLSDYMKTLNEKTIPDLISLKKTAEISVILPEFKTTFDTDLKDTLKKMGLGIAFDKAADFSNMGKDSSGLYLSAVKHKTYLKVDELGTSAGAVTDAEMLKSAISNNRLVYNRPFVYAIIDTKTNLPLFIGAMENPQN